MAGDIIIGVTVLLGAVTECFLWIFMYLVVSMGNRDGEIRADVLENRSTNCRGINSGNFSVAAEDSTSEDVKGMV